MDSKPKILIVDDRPENLVALKVVLKDLDVELIEANNGNDALKATLKHNFALALLDIQMPDMDGYELAEILREEEKTSALPFIFISAVYTDNLNVFKGYESGAFSFITKPFHPDILINKVKFFIDKHQKELSLIKLNEDLKYKNEEMEMSNQELESFSYSISHDLRAPLRSINGFSEVLKQDYQSYLDDQGKHYLNRIIENGLKMNSLIDSLLNLSRMGRKEIQKEEINISAMVDNIVNEFNGDVQHANIMWDISELVSIKGDQQLIKQVFFNLISNAVKYSSTKESPSIKIGYELNDGLIIYFVKDNGVGFNMKYADKLFGVFQRLHSAEEFEGNGVGLAIVKRIVTRHGGNIWAEGEVGRGSSFYFSFPQKLIA